MGCCGGITFDEEGEIISPVEFKQGAKNMEKDDLEVSSWCGVQDLFRGAKKPILKDDKQGDQQPSLPQQGEEAKLENDSNDDSKRG